MNLDVCKPNAQARRRNLVIGEATIRPNEKLVTYVAFSDSKKAALLERYLKSGSGHAFAKKRLW